MPLLQPLLTIERLYNRLTPVNRGRYAATQLIGWGINRLGLRPPSLRAPYGVRLTYVPEIAHDVMVRDTVLRGRFEEMKCQILRSLTPAGGVFIDVGANIGYFSLMASRWVGPDGRVCAIEAVPSTYALLAHNIELNRASNVTSVQAAGGARPGLQAMVRDADSGRSRLSPDGTGTHTVSVTTIDDLVSEHGLHRVDIIKTDLEWADFQVILGAQATIACHRPAIWLETLWLNRHGGSIAAVVAFLADLGYGCLQMMSERSTDLLCLPNP